MEDDVYVPKSYVSFTSKLLILKLKFDEFIEHGETWYKIQAYFWSILAAGRIIDWLVFDKSVNIAIYAFAAAMFCWKVRDTYIKLNEQKRIAKELFDTHPDYKD